MSRLQLEIKQNRAFASPEQETFLNLVRSAGALSAPFNQLFKDHELSLPQYNVLRILRGHDGVGLSCSQISERMVTRDSDITRLVDRLVKGDLASRRRSESDRRVVLIGITARGRRLLADLEGPVTDAHKSTLGHLSAAELAELNRLLVKARSPESEDN